MDITNQSQYVTGVEGGEKIKDLTAEQEFQVLKLAYDKHCANWRHYDSHIWQIPSLAMVINGFVIAQAFNPNMMGSQFVFIRAMIIFMSGYFTFVLLVALIKHRLHEISQDKNIELLEKCMGIHSYRYPFNNTKDIHQVEPNPFFLESILGSFKASKWLMSVMMMIVLIDFGILFGVILGKW